MRAFGRLAAATVSAAALFGGLVAIAPAASALPAACTKDTTFPVPLAETVTANVNLRKNPGTGSTSLGILAKGTKFTGHCLTNKGGTNWEYGKVTSGANKGKWGWVAWEYLRD
ncbi:SH3 domain-containing protein [Streptomyces sp. NPDC048751]|uniref:SH3 domain-containing protein n=1 Tax=Streptomyces sp. NPDC048751 TaxID=3365591 RepID=UPI003714F808